MHLRAATAAGAVARAAVRLRARRCTGWQACVLRPHQPHLTAAAAAAAAAWVAGEGGGGSCACGAHMWCPLSALVLLMRWKGSSIPSKASSSSSSSGSSSRWVRRRGGCRRRCCPCLAPPARSCGCHTPQAQPCRAWLWAIPLVGAVTPRGPFKASVWLHQEGTLSWGSDVYGCHSIGSRR